jgi:hypothetical protein
MRDGHGHVILDGTVSVYLAGTTTAADVYEASTGGTAVNSVTSSSTDGTFAFYVDLDAYDAGQLFKVTLSKAGYSTSTYDDIAVITPVFTGGLAGKVDLDGSNLALGSDADGDMYYRSGGVLARLPKGDVGQSLVMGASLPAWDDTLAGKMELDGSNLAIGLDADGDIYYRSSGALTRLPKGTAGHLLTMGADVPGWSALAQVDHGSLAGLSDDDHTQYHTDARGDARYEPKSSDFTSKVSAASDTAAGKVELATDAETTTGTSGSLAVTPDGLAGSNFGKRVVEWFIFDPGASLSVGDGKAYFVVPTELNGMNLVRVAATVITAGTTNSTTVQIHNATDSVDMLSTLMNIETGETSTRTSATPGTIDTTKDDVATGDVLRCDIDAVSTTEPKGLIVEMVFQLP